MDGRTDGRSGGAPLRTARARARRSIARGPLRAMLARRRRLVCILDFFAQMRSYYFHLYTNTVQIGYVVHNFVL